MSNVRQPSCLRNCLLDAAWKWCGDEVRAGREIVWSDLAPIRDAFTLLRDGGSVEVAAVIAGKNDISLLIWERALDIRHGLTSTTNAPTAPGENRA